jgi:hypothetical protein
MSLPIGHLLVEIGAISDKQRVFILEEQKVSGRPFGEIAETMFGVSPAAVERAWSMQYAATTRWIDPTVEGTHEQVRELITSRQAWQFRLLPIRMDGSDVMMCTTPRYLVRALNFATRQMSSTCFFVLSEPEALGKALVSEYPMPGMSADMIASEDLAVALRSQ